jgi:hypothetical protein
MGVVMLRVIDGTHIPMASFFCPRSIQRLIYPKGPNG